MKQRSAIPTARPSNNSRYFQLELRMPLLILIVQIYWLVPIPIDSGTLPKQW